MQPLGDLERLHRVLDVLPDEPLMQVLETGCGRGRNDYPVRAMWNSLVAGIIFQHGSVESLRRELARNGQLRELCGFIGRVPSAWAYTRLLHRVLDQAPRVETIFDTLVAQLAEVLPDFGQSLALDSKSIPLFAKHRTDDTAADGRRRLREKELSRSP